MRRSTNVLWGISIALTLVIILSITLPTMAKLVCIDQADTPIDCSDEVKLCARFEDAEAFDLACDDGESGTECQTLQDNAMEQFYSPYGCATCTSGSTSDPQDLIDCSAMYTEADIFYAISCPTSFPDKQPGCVASKDLISSAPRTNDVTLFYTPTGTSTALKVQTCVYGAFGPTTDWSCSVSDQPAEDITLHPYCSTLQTMALQCVDSEVASCYDIARNPTSQTVGSHASESCSQSNSETWFIQPTPLCAEFTVSYGKACKRSSALPTGATGSFPAPSTPTYTLNDDCTPTAPGTLTFPLSPLSPRPTQCGTPTTECIQQDSLSGKWEIDPDCAIQAEICSTEKSCASVFAFISTQTAGFGCVYDVNSTLQIEPNSFCGDEEEFLYDCSKHCTVKCGPAADNLLETTCGNTDTTSFAAPTKCGEDFTRVVAVFNYKDEEMTCPGVNCGFPSSPALSLSVSSTTTPSLATLCKVEYQCRRGTAGSFTYESCQCDSSTAETSPCTVYRECLLQTGTTQWEVVSEWENDSYKADVQALCVPTCFCQFGCSDEDTPTQLEDLDQGCLTSVGFTQCDASSCSTDAEGVAIPPSTSSRPIFCIDYSSSTPAFNKVTNLDEYLASTNCPETDEAVVEALFSKECDQIPCTYTWLCNNDIEQSTVFDQWPTEDVSEFLDAHDCSAKEYTATCFSKTVDDDELVENICPRPVEEETPVPSTQFTLAKLSNALKRAGQNNKTHNQTFSPKSFKSMHEGHEHEPIDAGLQYRTVGCFVYNTETNEQVIVDTPTCAGTEPAASKPCDAPDTGCFLTDPSKVILAATTTTTETAPHFVSSPFLFAITYPNVDFVPFVVQFTKLSTPESSTPEEGEGEEQTQAYMTPTATVPAADDPSLVYTNIFPIDTAESLGDGNIGLQLDPTTLGLGERTIGSFYFRISFSNGFIIYPADKSTPTTLVNALTCSQVPCTGSNYECTPPIITDPTNIKDAVCTLPSENPDDGKIGTTAIVLAIVIPIVAVLIIAVTIIILCCFCFADKNVSSSSSSSSKKQQQHPRLDHLELS